MLQLLALVVALALLALFVALICATVTQWTVSVVK